MARDEGNWGVPIVALTAFFLALVILFLLLRIITRIWIVKSFWWDDFTIILAVVRELISNLTKMSRFLTRRCSSERQLVLVLTLWKSITGLGNISSSSRHISCKSLGNTHTVNGYRHLRR